MARFPSTSSNLAGAGTRQVLPALQRLALLTVLLAGLALAALPILPESPALDARSWHSLTGGTTSGAATGHVAETSSLRLDEASSGSAGRTLAAVSSAQATSPAVDGLTAFERWRSAGVILVTDGQEWDEESLAAVDTALSAVPPALLRNAGNPALGPLHILVNSHGRTLSGKQPHGGPANFFSTNDGLNELVLFPRQRVATVVHELGHAYNLRRTAPGRYALVLLDAEMQSFLAATGWRVLSPAGDIQRAVDHFGVQYVYDGSFTWPRVSNMDPLEDFANSFAMFVLNPSGLMSSSPERYQWFETSLGRY